MNEYRGNQLRIDYADRPRNLKHVKRRPPKQRGFFSKLFYYVILWGGLAMALFISVLYLRLPDVNELINVRYQQPLRILTADGALISQIGEIKRDPIPYNEIPEDLTNALLSAEDSRFFNHIGLDFRSLARAILQLVTSSPNQTGASTITMQVARNYYLTRDRTLMRKLNEILLAIKMERVIDKEEILSLYVNTIFLGFKSFGMAAAAKTYYNTDIRDLSLAQYAMLSALPKAPSGMNPISNPSRAKERRDWILGRMFDLGYISRADYLGAVAQDLTARPYDYNTEVEGLFLAEAARLEILNNPSKYNITKDEIYTKGYQIYTSADKEMQNYANKAVRNGLLAYDRRHGWRGAEKQFLELTSPGAFVDNNKYYTEALAELATISSYDNSLEPVIVKRVNERSIEVVNSLGETIKIEWSGLRWGAPYISNSAVGSRPSQASDLVAVGDLVRISPDSVTVDGERVATVRLSQIPRAEGALLAVNPNNGLILAMVGGYHFQLTKYNRAIQARRQIGSAIKPILYAAALDEGYNGADIFKDAPLVSQSSGNLFWRPSNAGDTFLGTIPMREGLYKSRNLVSVRLMRQLGVAKTREFMEKFGLPKEHLPADLSLALGSSGLTLVEAARAYSVFANGGYLVEPRFILRIELSDGQLVYEADNVETLQTNYVPATCVYCNDNAVRHTFSADQRRTCNNVCRAPWQGEDTTIGGFGDEEGDDFRLDPNQGEQSSEITEVGQIADEAYSPYPRVISPEVHYQIHSILKDVVARGTATQALSLGRRDLAGKTGTTQNYVDAWFSGYNPSLVAVTWVGFDQPATLGPREFGGTAALPIWTDFMGAALKGTSHKDFYRPYNLVEVGVTVPNENGDRRLNEFVDRKHLGSYINRVQRDSAYIGYRYQILDGNLGLEEGTYSNSGGGGGGGAAEQEVKDLF